MSKRRFQLPVHRDPPTVRRVAAALLVGAGLSLPFHLGWEVAQLPLYTLWHEPDRLRIAWAILHCTAGDVLIACSSFALVSVGLRGTDWPAHLPGRGLLLIRRPADHPRLTDLGLQMRPALRRGAGRPRAAGRQRRTTRAPRRGCAGEASISRASISAWRERRKSRAVQPRSTTR